MEHRSKIPNAFTEGEVVRPTRVYINTEALRWAHSLQANKAHHRAVLLELARKADEHGASSATCKNLATEIAVSARTVRRCLHYLETQRLIRRIGRLGRHGGQVSNVFILIGWPGRKPIPSSGHPRFGRFVQENTTSILGQIQRKRTLCHGGADRVSDQNKENIIKDTTTIDRSNRSRDILAKCFQALGPWATEKNRQALIADFGSLETILGKGIDHNCHILPVLKKFAQRQVIPSVRTWKYFEEAFERQKEHSLGRAPAGDTETRAQSPSGEPAQKSHDEDRPEKATSTAFDAEMQDFLRKAIKQAPRVS